MLWTENGMFMRPMSAEMSRLIHIRDPIHGTIEVTASEIRLIDHPVFQRLRNIKQLGFADLAFPGATHSRYSHSLGAMHVATRLFDRLFADRRVPERVRDRFRQAVRLAMLFHDVGHAPMSHTTETIMPPVGELGLGALAGNDVSRRATHEDYTLKIVLDSSLAEELRSHFGATGLVPEDIAEIIAADRTIPSGRFRHAGTDYTPVLRQIVSSECDADRMDYLQRDSFFSGVSYGRFDAAWLIDNVICVEDDRSVYLGLRSRASFSFEDFLLSRYHMFASVYLHHTPVIFERMLLEYFKTSDEFSLSADVEKYAALDDMDLWATLRRSKNPWARRIVERRPLTMLLERNESAAGGHRRGELSEAVTAALSAAGVPFLHTRSRSVLSKYFGQSHSAPIFVITGTNERILLQDFTPLYRRYETPALLSRVFVAPEDKKRARVELDEVSARARAERGAGEKKAAARTSHAPATAPGNGVGEGESEG